MKGKQHYLMIRNEQGGSLVEFAIIAPLLFLILFGIIEFGIMLYDKAMITNAAREGARAGIVYDFYDNDTPELDDDTYHPPDKDIIEAVNNYCKNYLITFSSSTLDPPQITQINRTGDASGDVLTVTVNYTYDFLVLPSFVSSLVGGVGIKAESVMRME